MFASLQTRLVLAASAVAIVGDRRGARSRRARARGASS